MQTLQQDDKRRIRRQVSEKQAQALRYLRDDETAELVFGGGAAGGKSRLGCMHSIDLCLMYEGIRIGIGREELVTLKKTTLLTLFDQMQLDGLKDSEDYVYNQQANTITFPQTGSVIYLIELKLYPSDPNFDRLGSYELTFGFIDEAQQVTQKAKDVFASRIRYKLEVNKLIAKLLQTCNPSKNFLYSEYYQPWKRGELPKHKKFLQALVTDNPFIGDTYIENLRQKPKEMRERLLFGNWEYDDDPTKLIDYEAINDLFTNIVVPMAGPEDKFIIADIARKGQDRTVLSYWEGFTCKRIAAFSKLALVPDPNNPEIPSSAGHINTWRTQYAVPLSKVLVDEDGMGGGVKDYLGCKGFVNNSRPLRDENYQNLKSQCYFALASKINAREMRVETTNEKLKQLITEELEQVKQHNMDKDGKVAVVPKDTVKEHLGRSPDFSDTLMMRMYFTFGLTPRITWA